MKRFSERNGFVPPKELQINELDKDTRIDLWNTYLFYFGEDIQHLRYVYTDVFKRRFDEIPGNVGLKRNIGDWLIEGWWCKTFEFIELVFRIADKTLTVYDDYKSMLNILLEENNVGYRIVGSYVVPITNALEGEEIEAALKQGGVVQQHIETAVKLFSDRKNPDFRNSCNESISAVEAAIQELTGKTDFSDAIKQLAKESGSSIHGAFIKVFDTMYGHASDGGIRHALKEDQEITFEDARYYLVSCSAFINYLKIKASKSEKDHDLT